MEDNKEVKKEESQQEQSAPKVDIPDLDNMSDDDVISWAEGQGFIEPESEQSDYDQISDLYEEPEDEKQDQDSLLEDAVDYTQAMGVGASHIFGKMWAPKALAHLNAAYEKGKSLFTQGDVSDYSVIYDKYKKEYYDAFEDVIKESPAGYYTGLIGTTLATAVATPHLAGARALGAALAAGSFTGAGEVYDLQFNEETAEKIATGAAFGAGGHTIGAVLGKGFKAGKKAYQTMKGTLPEEAVPLTGKFANDRHNYAVAKVFDMLSETKADTQKTIDAIIKKGDDNALNSFFDSIIDIKDELAGAANHSDVLNVIRKSAQKYGQQIKPFEEMVDTINSESMKKQLINSEKLVQDLKSIISDHELLPEKEAAHLLKYTKNLLAKNLDSDTVTAEISVKDLRNLKEFAKRQLKGGDDSQKAIADRVIGISNEYMEEHIEKVLRLNDPEKAGQYVKLKDRYTHFRGLRDVADAAAAEQDSIRKKLGPQLQTIYTQAGIAAVSGLAAEGLVTGDVTGAGALAGLIPATMAYSTIQGGLHFMTNAITKQSMVGKYRGAVSQAEDLMRAARAVEKSPGKYSKQMFRIMRAAYDKKPELFAARMGALTSMAFLEENPVQNSVEDVQMKSSKILAALNEGFPEETKQFRAALESGDVETIGKMTELIKETPVGKRIINFSGPMTLNGTPRLFSDTAKAMAKSMVQDAFRSGDMSASQKMKAFKEIRAGQYPSALLNPEPAPVIGKRRSQQKEGL